MSLVIKFQPGTHFVFMEVGYDPKTAKVTTGGRNQELTTPLSNRRKGKEENEKKISIDGNLCDTAIERSISGKLSGESLADYGFASLS